VPKKKWIEQKHDGKNPVTVFASSDLKKKREKEEEGGSENVILK